MIEANLARCLTTPPAPAAPFQIGVMLGRAAAGFRLGIVQLPVLPDPSPAGSALPAAMRIATEGKPWAKGKNYWRRAPVSHKRSA